MRQYIGARYVPKFAEPVLHDSTRTYEAFEIVQNAVGDSFTSKRPVPVGIALTDTTYWVSSGSFNSQLALVSNRVSAIESGARFKPEAGKLLMIGDSYAVDSVVNPTWTDEVASYMGLTSPTQYQAFGYGARGFASAAKFIDALTADINNITDKEKITNIIICGGANDVGQTYAAIKTAIDNFRDYCLSQFPNAQLYIGFIGWSRNATSTWRDTIDYYKKACTELGIPYLNGVEVPMHNLSLLQNTAGNYHHPTASGSAALGLAITNAILTGDANYEDKGLYTVSAYGTHLLPSAPVYYEVKNGQLRLWSDVMVYGNTGGSSPGTTALPYGSLVKIGTISTDSWIGKGIYDSDETGREMIRGVALLGYSAETTAHPVEIIIENGDVYLRNMGPGITDGFGGGIRTFSCIKNVLDNYTT